MGVKPAYTREHDSWGLRHARKPIDTYNLSGVVYVLYRGRGYAYVKFTDKLVTAVGRKLPYGVGPDRMAYLRLVHLHALDKWRLYAMYLEGTKGVLLVEYDTQPEWLHSVRRDINGNGKKARDAHAL